MCDKIGQISERSDLLAESKASLFAPGIKGEGMDIINQLENIGGNATSMISLILPYNVKLADINNKLNYESTTANNIKNRTNRHSVQSAIKNVKYHLGSIKKIPKNGMAIFAGENNIHICQETNCYI